MYNDSFCVQKQKRICGIKKAGVPLPRERNSDGKGIANLSLRLGKELLIQMLKHIYINKNENVYPSPFSSIVTRPYSSGGSSVKKARTPSSGFGFGLVFIFGDIRNSSSLGVAGFCESVVITDAR